MVCVRSFWNENHTYSERIYPLNLNENIVKCHNKVMGKEVPQINENVSKVYEFCLFVLKHLQGLINV